MGTLSRKSILEVSVMRYPVWFPYPGCWLRAIVLIISWIPTALVTYVIVRLWVIPSAFLPSDIEARKPFIIAWFLLAVVVAPVFILSHIHEFLWSDPNPKFPRWLPNLKSLGNGLFGWIVMIVSLMLTIILIPLPYYYYHQYPYYFSYRYIDDDMIVQIASTLWVFVIAYFYHARLLVVRKFFVKEKV